MRVLVVGSRQSVPAGYDAVYENDPIKALQRGPFDLMIGTIRPSFLSIMMVYDTDNAIPMVKGAVRSDHEDAAVVTRMHNAYVKNNGAYHAELEEQP